MNMSLEEEMEKPCVLKLENSLWIGIKNKPQLWDKMKATSFERRFI